MLWYETQLSTMTYLVMQLYVNTVPSTQQQHRSSKNPQPTHFHSDPPVCIHPGNAVLTATAHKGDQHMHTTIYAASHPNLGNTHTHTHMHAHSDTLHAQSASHSVSGLTWSSSWLCCSCCVRDCTSKLALRTFRSAVDSCVRSFSIASCCCSCSCWLLSSKA